MTVLEMIAQAVANVKAVDVDTDSDASDTADSLYAGFDDMAETVPADVRYSLHAPV